MTTSVNLTFFRTIIICCLLLLGLLAACKDDKTGLQSGDPTDFKDAVVINQYGITSITISDKKNTIIHTGMTQQYTAQGNTASGGSVDISKDVHWSVSDGSAARIDENGLLTGLAQNDVTVTAQLSTYSVTKSLRVTDASVSNITITKANGSTDFTIAVDACKTLQLKAVADYTGETLTQDVTNEVDWSTTSLSTVAHFSTLTGEKGWLLTSTVSSGISVSATLYAFPANVTVITKDGFTSGTSGISLNPSSSYSLPSTSASKQFSASATFFDNTSADITRAALWSSDNAAIASVNNDVGSKGLVTAQAVGSTTIKAQCGTATDSTTVTVANNSLGSLKITYTTSNGVPFNTSAGGDLIYLHVNDTLDLIATAHYSDGTNLKVTTDSGTSWSLYPDSTVVSIDKSSGKLTAQATGTAVVKVSYQGLDASLTVIVQ